ncbi:MAG: HlyC/CorC family transporter [Rhodocyclaceae bacterium]|nr:HlyC/CorC family transporter [Rhodocyclaceae bacterium]
MDEVPLPYQFLLLGLLLVCSGFFSMAETAMMASNRHRLRHMAQQGQHGARLALALFSTTDKLLGVILLGNTLINAAAAMLTGYIALALFSAEKWALEAGTLVITFCLLVFSEITPKVIGATYPDWITPRISYVLTPLLRVAYPVIWFVNLFVSALLRLLNLTPKAGHEVPTLSPEELRSIVLESSHFIPSQNQAILLNLFDLAQVTIEDIMTPRAEIEAINLDAPIEEIHTQLATSYHTRLPVYSGDPGNVVGILHQRRLLAALVAGNLDHEEFKENLSKPYFIPAATPVYNQLRFFQENRQRFGLVVDEYGELLGLVTLEDIIEELIGKFTTTMPEANVDLTWDEGGAVTLDGGRPLRQINRSLDLNLPLDGPKTLNGLVLEHFEDIPESGVSLQIAGIRMEILQVEDRRVKRIRLFHPGCGETK